MLEYNIDTTYEIFKAIAIVPTYAWSTSLYFILTMVTSESSRTLTAIYVSTSQLAQTIVEARSACTRIADFHLTSGKNKFNII